MGPLSAAAHGGACGVARVLALEHPSTRVVAADAGGGATDAAAVRGVAHAALALAAGGGDGANFESELAWCGGGAHAARLRRRETVDGARVGGGGRGGGGWASCGGGACVVSGGLGGLGLRAAAEAAAGGARALVLSSRSGRVARGGQGLDEQLRAVRSARGCAVRVIACDVGEAASARALLGAAASSGHALRAVMHAAGVGAALLVGNMHHGVVDAVVRPKAAAAWHVHRGVAASCVSPLLLFSSVAAAFGNAGQAGYAAANAYLDALARGRRAHGLAARSAQLPLVGGAGMGAAAFGGRQQRYRGMAAIALDEYAASVRVLLARPEAGGGLALTVRAVLPGAAAALLDAVPGAAAASKLFADVAVAADAADGASSVAGAPRTSAWAASVARLPLSSRASHVEAEVVRAVRSLTGDGGADAATPLMEAGVDSLAATELVSQLRALTGLELSPTLVFEHPTPRAIATHLSARAGGADGDGGAAAAAADASDVTAMRAAAGGGAVAVGSAVGRWPGGAPTVGALWAALRAGGDLVTAVPAARWTADQAAAARPLSEREAACVRHGGFVAGAERFDGRFFGVSAAEAAAIDPQQRLLLEHGYEALHGAAPAHPPFFQHAQRETTNP